MIESILTQRNRSLQYKMAVKSVCGVVLVAMAVLSPQIVHVCLGRSGGAEWLPMYWPVLLAGCLLGAVWGLAVGVLSPLVSFAVTGLAGNAMPAATRLPFMMAELAVFAAVSGLFSKKIAAHGWMALPAVLSAQVAGRAVFLLSAIVFRAVSPLSPQFVWAQIKAGLPGTVLQAVAVPLAVMVLRLLCKGKENDGHTDGEA